MHNVGSSRSPPFLAHAFCRRLLNDAPGKRHAKDGVTRAGLHENNLSPMFRSNALCQREPKARTFLLSLADKRLEEAGPDALRNSGAIVLHFHDDCSILHAEPRLYSGFVLARSRRLARVEQKVVDR